MSEHDDISRRIAQKKAVFQNDNDEKIEAERKRKQEIEQERLEVEAKFFEKAPKLRELMDDEELEFLLREIWNRSTPTETKTETVYEGKSRKPKIISTEVVRTFEVRKIYPILNTRTEVPTGPWHYTHFYGSMEMDTKSGTIKILLDDHFGLKVWMGSDTKRFMLEQLKDALIECIAFYDVNGNGGVGWSIPLGLENTLPGYNWAN